MPTRRNALITIGGAVTIAGCSSSEPESQGNSEPEENTSSSPENETESVGNKTNQEEVENETEEEDGEENEEEEPQDPQQIAEIEAAINILEDSLQEYVSFLDNEEATILDVTSELEGFDFLSVVNTANDAEEELDEAEQFEDRESVLSTIETLRTEYNLIDTIARAQNQGQNSVTGAQELLTALEEDGQSTRAQNQLQDTIEEFEQYTTELQSDINGVSSPIVRDKQIYEQKTTQLQNELETIKLLSSIRSDFNEANNTLDSANTAYNNENYSQAERLAEDAEEQFSEIADTLSERDGTVLSDLVGDFESAVQSKTISAQSLQDRASNPPDN